MSNPPPQPIQPESKERLQARLAAIVAGSDDAIISKDLSGIVQSWNAAAERIFGYAADEMIGRPILAIIPADRQHEEPEILERLKRGERVDHFETVRRRKDGRLIHVSVTISPVRDATGQVIGASKIARDITELKQMIAERERLLRSEQEARKEAERVSRLKDEFLATLSHELRTPLNAILGWASLLKARPASAAELTEGLETIVRNARAQTQLIEELLDVSRIITGKLRLDVQSVDLERVIGDGIDSVRPAADGKGIRLLKILDPAAGHVRGDPARLQQVIWNLLTNAIKFTPKGGQVHVMLQRVRSHVEIIVADTGEGIPPEFLPDVFNRFSQADASTTRRHGGLGLGLAIVRHITELHGGTVSAASPGVGKGATFTVFLPLTAVHDERAQQVTNHAAATDLDQPAPGTLDLAGVSVLVVDDEPDARDLIRRLLERSGAAVTTASTVAEAIDALRRHRPHVLLSDIAMPGEDGFELLRQVRELPAAEGGSVPAAAITAFARSEDRRRALLAGFQLHVPKPVEPAELLAVVASLSGAVRSNPHRPGSRN
jgi:PAS domain S-box-containing protein